MLRLFTLGASDMMFGSSMIKTARAVSFGGCRPFSQTLAVSQKEIPPWALEKLRNEGHSVKDIETLGYESLLKQHHAIRPDLVFKLHKSYDFSLNGWLNHRKKIKEEKNIQDQTFSKQRFNVLGGELAGATFLVHRGAAVRFHERNKWIIRDPKTQHVDLPRTKVKGYSVEAIDMRDFHILWQGFENLKGLEQLRSLALRNQPHVDDWCLDLITALFHDTLEHIDLSGCSRVTERGIAILHRCRKLRSIHMNDMQNVQHAELLAIYLEEILPDVVIEGVDYSRKADNQS